MTSDFQLSELGYEQTITCNHFGHFYLTYLLWNSLLKSPQAKVISVSSKMHPLAPKDYLTNPNGQNRSYSYSDSYSISKLYNILFTTGLHQLIQKKGIKNVKAAVLHPGIINSGFGSDNCLVQFLKVLTCCCLSGPETGARTSLYLSRIPYEEFLSGEYYFSDTKVAEMDKRGRNEEDVKKLWEISEKAYGVRFE